jgi:outer membrane autotransporter protein
VDITAEGAITVRCNAITTAGLNSDAVRIDGGAGNVLVDVARIVTAGANADGIDVITDTGAQTILAGSINVAGPGSDGVSAVGTGCADISITASGPIVSAQGTGIFASTRCSVTVTTLQGAPVTGRLAGIDVTSGTGATITIGDNLTSAVGPALNVDGAAARVTIGATGSITGRIDLTDSNDIFINNGLFVPVGTSNFGGGLDTVTNNGTIRVAGTPALAGCETFTNRGLITMVNGTATDRLTICGNYTGEAGSRLAIDVAASTNGTPTDQLFIGGNAAGNTQVTLNLLGGPGVTNATGALVVDAATASGNPFSLAGPVRSGFVDYSLVQRASDTFLVALPNELAIEPLLLGGIGLDFWYQSADAWSESAAIRRANLGSETPRGTSFWVQGYGSDERRGGQRDIDVFGTSRETNLRFETERRGVQGGVDISTGGAMAFGVTGGYQKAASALASGTRIRLDGHNVGAYMLYGRSTGVYAEVLAKVDFFDGRIVNGGLFGNGQIDGESYGAEGELGYRLLTSGLQVDLGAGLAYVRTTLDSLEGSNFRFDFDRAESLRGRIGVRVGGTGGLAPYADVKVFHEFMGDNNLAVDSGGFTLNLTDEREGTWFRGELGITGEPGRSGGFASAWIERGDVRSYGVRVGFRF